MFEVKRKREVIEMLSNAFNKVDFKGDELFISDKSISLIFLGGRYGIKDVTDAAFSHNNGKTNNHEKMITKKGQERNFNYYFNLKFLSSIIEKITDDKDDLEAFYIFFDRNIEILDTTTPQDCDKSLTVCKG